MKITQEVREYAKEKKINDIKNAIQTGMKEKSKEFLEKGTKIYNKM